MLHTYKIKVLSQSAETTIYRSTDYSMTLAVFARTVIDTAESCFIELLKDAEILRTTIGRKR